MTADHGKPGPSGLEPDAELRHLESLQRLLDEQDAMLLEMPAGNAVPVAGAKSFISIFEEIEAGYPGLVPEFRFHGNPIAVRSQLRLARGRLEGRIVELKHQLEGAENAGPTPTGNRICIAHGRSEAWRELKNFIEGLGLGSDEFNRVPTAGMATVERLQRMLDDAAFALIVMTAEDEQPGGTLRARQNVVHEAGLFQGHLGFKRAIILQQDDCCVFSNIEGLTVIRFQIGRIGGVFEEVRRVLKATGLLPG